MGTVTYEPCRNFSAALNANPCATDVNSFPLRMRSLPNRVSKIRRTAGKKSFRP